MNEPRTRRSAAAGLLLLAATATSAAGASDSKLDIPAGRYQLDKNHASLTFRVLHMGLSHYTARFTRFDATVDLDPNDLAASRVEATIHPASVETDYPGEKDFDREIASGDPGFLEAAKFPRMRFVSKRVEPTGERTLRVTGDLTMKGVTRPVSLDVEIVGAKLHPFRKQPAFGIAARGALDRSQWGVSGYLPDIVADRVQLEIHAELIAESR
jgi:polyisoprenoid-binding protein YceI